MNTTIPAQVTYPCPRCGVSLQARASDVQEWYKCPACGQAGRAPAVRRAAPMVADDILYIGTFATGPAQGQAGAPAMSMGTARPYDLRRVEQARGETSRRIMIGGGFFLAAFLAIVSVAQKNPPQAGIFGFMAVLALFLLARSSARG